MYYLACIIFTLEFLTENWNVELPSM